jgi:hypothetical protein
MSSDFRLKDYTFAPLEIVIVVFSLLPFLISAFFYNEMPAQIPAFLQLDGSVVRWIEKSPLSAFRLPLMAFLMQIIALIVKWNAVVSPVKSGDEEFERMQEQSVRFNTRLWDCLRTLIALKIGGTAMIIVFLSVERLNFLSAPVFWATSISAFAAFGYGLYNRYRLRELKKQIHLSFGGQKTRFDERRVYGGIFYFNPQDPSVFAGKHVFNFGNPLVYVFLICAAAYPLMVLSAV